MDINKNYPLDIDSYTIPTPDEPVISNTFKHKQSAGQTNTDIPTGGTPPIYLCESIKDNETNDEQSKREYKTHKTAVSIKNILEKRRDVKPFLV
jgi:hypothetical protein